MHGLDIFLLTLGGIFIATWLAVWLYDRLKNREDKWQAVYWVSDENEEFVEWPKESDRSGLSLSNGSSTLA